VFFRRPELELDVNAADDEHVVFRFHLAQGFRFESAFSGGNLSRLQRAS
jgi:hypothetical protein